MVLRAAGLLAILCCVVVAGCGGCNSAGVGGPEAAPTDTARVPSVSPARAEDLGLTRAVPAAYRLVCAKQAAYAPPGARVCPPLIPGGTVEVEHAAPFSQRKQYRGGYQASFTGAVTPSRQRGDTHGGHWAYGVAWTSAVRELLVQRGVLHPSNARESASCGQVSLGDEHVTACRVVDWAQGGGFHGGHIVYVWQHGRVTYVLSLHGYANERRARAMTAALMAEVLRR